jgi:hypothetical protein
MLQICRIEARLYSSFSTGMKGNFFTTCGSRCEEIRPGSMSYFSVR